MPPVCEKGRKRRLTEASRRGLTDGVASVFSILGRGRPAPVLIRRDLGSLEDDLLALQRDCERLLDGTS
jgi:hypothetical protein